MKFALYIMLMLPLCYGQPVPPLQQLRALYRYSVTEKDSSAKLQQLTSVIDSAAAPVLCCYKGVAQIMQARFTGSPFNKLKKFNAGKAIMEVAIARDTLDVEMRVLRYAIQSNAPGFLGYNSNLQNDKAFLIANYNRVDDAALKLMITNALAAAKKSK